MRRADDRDFRLPTIAAGILGVYALASELRVLPGLWLRTLDRIPGEWLPGYDAIPDGLLALTTLVLVFLIAPVVHDRWAPAAGIAVLVLGLASAIVVIAELPANVDPAGRAAPAVASTPKAMDTPSETNVAILSAPHQATRTATTPALWLQLGLLVILGPLVGRLFLLHRYARLGRNRVDRPPAALDDLLGSQRRSLGQLRQAVLRGELWDEGRLVQLEGRWGESKSFFSSGCHSHWE